MIGVFDSGIGGLTVLRALRRNLPEYSFIYFGDTARTPYGGKSAETILEYGREDAHILTSRGAKIIVIACNTVSTIASDTLRGEFANIPIFEVITPAVRQAVAVTKTGRVGVIGTRATIGSGVYQKALKESSGGRFLVEALACPIFVPLVEEGWESSPEAQAIVKRSLKEIKLKGLDTLILGCTHYPILRSLIQEEVGRGIVLIDSAETIAAEVKRFLSENKNIDDGLQKNGNVSVFVSDKTERVSELSAEWLSGAEVKKIEP